MLKQSTHSIQRFVDETSVYSKIQMVPYAMLDQEEVPMELEEEHIPSLVDQTALYIFLTEENLILKTQ